MIYVLTGLSLFFVALGFLVTEQNAKYLLSGYNTMREEDQAKVDIKAYIKYFRKFHIFLGLSFLLFGTVIIYAINENAGGFFLGIYPILAYIYFMATSANYSKGLSAKWNNAGVIVLALTLILVVGIFFYGTRESKLFFGTGSIEFDGAYGETLKQTEIQSVELVHQLPKITVKKNGYALGTINKGYFKTSDGEIVKLILNADNKPVLLFTKTDGNKIYYSAKNKSNQEVMEEMRKSLPDVVYKQ